MCIASMAQRDWPSDWPSFFDDLLPCLSSDDGVLRRGALRTVHLFAADGDVDTAHLPRVVECLVPQLMQILLHASDEQYDGVSRARALAVFRSVLTWVAFEKQHTLPAFADAVPPALNCCLALLQHAAEQRVRGEPAASFAFEIEAVGLVADLVTRFRAQLEPLLPLCVGAVVRLLTAALEPYLALAAREGGSHQTDADGNEVGLEALALVACEVVGALLRVRKSAKHFEPLLDELCRCVIGYATMTFDDVQLWESDANEFIESEDSVFRWSLRLCATQLSDAIVNRFAVAGLNALLDAASQWCARDDWRARESAELIVGNVAGELAGANRALRDDAGAPLVRFSATAFVEDVLVPDVRNASGHAFLAARALWCAAEFTSDMPIALVAPFLQYCADALAAGADTPEPVLVMATQAIYKFCKPLAGSRRHEAAAVESLLPTLIAGLASLLPQASESQLVQLMDALGMAQCVSAAATAALAPQVLPYVLAVWSKHANDALLVDSVQDCIRSYTKVPACLPLVAAALERPIATLLRAELADNVDVLCLRVSLLLIVGALVDGFDSLAGAPPLTAPSFLVDTALPLVAEIALTTVEHESMQDCAIALTAYARRFVPASNDDAAASRVIELLLRCTARLLSPELDDSATYHVGSLVSALLGGPSRALVQPHLDALLQATYARLGAAKSPLMIVELLVVFVRLFRHDADAVSQWLAAMPADGRSPIAAGQPSESGLHYVLGLWVMHHPTLVGAFVTKLSAAVLLQLIATSLGDVPVPGRQIIEERRAGPRRSGRLAAKAIGAAAVERWTSVPLRVKVVQLLATNYRDALLTDLTGGVPDEVADEFEDDGDDDDDDDDDGGGGEFDDELYGGGGGGGGDDDEDDDPNAAFYRYLSQYDSADEDVDGDREEVDEPDIVHDPLYPVKFNEMLAEYFGTTARDCPQLLQAASDEGLLDNQQRRDIESAVTAFQAATAQQ
jgi:hypothetical protein